MKLDSISKTYPGDYFDILRVEMGFRGLIYMSIDDSDYNNAKQYNIKSVTINEFDIVYRKINYKKYE